EEVVEQGTNLIIEDSPTPTNDLNEIVEPFSLKYEIDVEGNRAQPPRHNLSNEEYAEEVGEQGIEFEEASLEPFREL
ncbi:hypothetical protein Q8G41_28890, partial [Klebsiella pneumoniae]|uniref:hypothetical protein n=1 Tax=Klebsiella pneumoniae TaxID=573 RepID=UPI003013BD62